MPNFYDIKKIDIRMYKQKPLKTPHTSQKKENPIYTKNTLYDYIIFKYPQMSY